VPKPPRRSTSRPGAGSRPGSAGRPDAGFGSRPIRAKRIARQPIRESFLQRNRTRLLWAAAGLAAVVIGGLFYLQATTPAYACAIEWAAPATPSPAPSATPRLGYPQEDMGKEHVPPGTVVRYIYCPPASGKHYDNQGQGPIDPKLYGPNDRAIPQGWIHNLEHGGFVLLYKCPGDGCTDAGQEALRAFWASFPASPICDVPAHKLSPVIARFDTMTTNYAAIVWDEVLPLDQLDTAQLVAFFAQQGERTNPEPQCAPPSAAPSAAPSPAPSSSAGPAESAAPSAPAASDVPSQSAAPAAS
jgi:hypothetical protein